MDLSHLAEMVTKLFIVVFVTVVVVVALPSPLSETRSLASTLGIVNGTWSIHWASFVMQEANRTLRTKEWGGHEAAQKQHRSNCFYILLICL